ncbi:MAG: hypothetical protein AAFQ63_09055 [Cyanobacteria bacterium J06621_11]
MGAFAEHVPLFMGIISFIGGAATWYGAAVKKNYASERDFNHLKRNYEGLTANVGAMDKMLDDRLDRIELQIAEAKALQQAILTQIGSGNSSIIQPRR